MLVEGRAFERLRIVGRRHSAPPRRQRHLDDTLRLTSHGDPIALPKRIRRPERLTIDERLVRGPLDRRYDPLPSSSALEHALAVVPELTVGSELSHERLAELG